MISDTIGSTPGMPAILGGLGEVADGYDVLLCDVWGVLHDGRVAHGSAVEALQRFHARRGPVILLSNAPRPAQDVEEQLASLRVPPDCYDLILTSGMVARQDLQRRASGKLLRILHIGPERDRGLFEGLSVRCGNADGAEIALCTGLVDDDAETPEDYRALLSRVMKRGLTLLCANPDIVVQRGGKLVWCAGALARLYTELGGDTAYYGKPYAPIYAEALRIARTTAKRGEPRVLVLGDGLQTDIRGANLAGLDAIFIADGIHGEDVREMTAPAIAALCGQAGVTAMGAMRKLVW